MKRRGFLSILLIPLLPTPQLPMEQTLERAWDITIGKERLVALLAKDFMRIVNQPSITRRIMNLTRVETKT